MWLKTSCATRPQLSMRWGARYFVGGCAVLLAISSGALSIEASVATARLGAAASVTTVDHTRKGDRLPGLDKNVRSLSREIDSTRPSVRRDGLPEGCESLASSLTRSAVAKIAGRCLS